MMSTTDPVAPSPLDMMTAVRLHAKGDPRALALERVAIPHPRAGEAVVRVHAAAITRDELQWPAEHLPATPCHEFAGTVAAVAVDVRDLAVGDSVYALGPFDRDGAAAEFVRVPAAVLAHRPLGTSDVESAAIPLAALSAGQALFDHGRLQSGQRVLVHGAAGAVGAMAVQLAVARRAHVVATTSAAGASAVRLLGADRVVVHDHERFEDVAQDVDLVIDTLGHDMLQRSLAVLRRGGRFVTIAAEPDAAAKALARRHGVTTIFFIVSPCREQLERITSFVESGELAPTVDRVFEFADARAAFERSLDRVHAGKVVLRVAPG